MTALPPLVQSTRDFARLIRSLPPEALTEQDWGAREVLAHLVFHHEGYIRQVQAQLAEQDCPLPAGRFSEVNAQAVTDLRGVPVETLLERFERASDEICRLAAEHDPAAIFIQVKRGSKRWRLDDLIAAADGHVRGHLLKLRKEYR